MATDVNPNLLPVPAATNTPPARPVTPIGREPSDGRRFAEELHGPEQRPEAQRAVQNGAERASQAADQFHEKLDDKLAKVAKDKGDTDPNLQVVPHIAPDLATLDSKTFRLAMREHAGEARSSDPLAFLSGRLEEIDPAEIAELVSGNPFITQALAAGDLAGYLRQPVPVETLLSQFDVPDTVVQSIEAAGINLSGTITPRDFFRAVGVDPNRVSAELTLLADGLPLDGVKPYIERAQRMQAGGNGQAAKFNSEKYAENTDDQPVKVGSGVDSDPRLVGAMAALGKMDPSQPTTPYRSDRAVQQADLISPPGSVEASGPKPVDAAATPQVSAESLASPTMASMEATGIESLRGLAQGDASVARMRTTDGDPFTQMSARGGEFRSLDLTGLNAPSPRLGSTQGIEEALLQSNWTPGKQASTGQVDAPKLDSISGQLSLLTPQASAEPALGSGAANKAATAVMPQMIEKAAEQIDVDGEPMWKAPDTGKTVATATLGARNLASAAGVVAPQTNTAKIDSRIPVEELQLDVSQWKRDLPLAEEFGGSSFSGGNEQGQNNFQGDLNPFAKDTLSTPTDVRLGESMFTTELSHDAANGPTPGERAQAVQQIMDKAIMMTKSGGGSMQLDLSGLNIGQLEMAISVTGNRVDLRLLADSERVRDVLAGDLTVLRDALSSQNMTLTSVDVNVDKRDGEAQQNFAGSQQFDQQAEQHARQMQDDFSELMTGLGRRIQDAPMAAGSLGRMPVIPPQVYGQGKIALRV